MKTSGRQRKTQLAAPNGRLACAVCKGSKTRCDRAEPRCGRCVRLHLPCGYEGRISRSAEKTEMARQLAEMRDRLVRAEARLEGPSLPGSSIFPSNPDLVFKHIERPQSDAVLFTERSGSFFQQSRGPEVGRDSSFPDIPGIPDDPMEARIWPSLHPRSLMENPDPSLGSTSTLVEPPNNTTPFPIVSFTDPGIDQVNVISTSDLNALHDAFFDTWDAALPILSQTRFMIASACSPYSLDLCFLRYAVALMGTMSSPRFSHLEHGCYTATRKYLELCETSEDEDSITSLNAVQGLILVVRHELTRRRFRRAWMTLGRTVRLAKLLNLPKMDDRTGAKDLQLLNPNVPLPSTLDEVIVEERRRTFWALYIFESYASTHTEMPCQLGEIDLLINLPSSGRLDLAFQSTPMPTLHNMPSIHDSSSISSYAAIVLMVEVAYRCFDHSRSLKPTAEIQGFWDSHYSLVKHLNWLKGILDVHFEDSMILKDSLSLSLLMNFSAVEIILHESAGEKISRQGLSDALAAESRKSATTAAFRILDAVRITAPAHGSKDDMLALQAPFIGWPMVMAMKAFTKEVEHAYHDISDTHDYPSYICQLLDALDLVEDHAGHWHSTTNDLRAVFKPLEEQEQTLDLDLSEFLEIPSHDSAMQSPFGGC